MSNQLMNYLLSWMSDCPSQACVKCCTDHNCEPHREAREELRKKQSILDGTDAITMAAAKKRASKVAPGMFFDSNIEYFGETVVLWNVNEFMDNTKWREDAIRRSLRNKSQYGGGLEFLTSSGRKRKRRGTNSSGDNNNNEEGGEGPSSPDTTTSLEDDKDVSQKKTSKKKNKKSMSRKERFKAICDELYQKSLV